MTALEIERKYLLNGLPVLPEPVETWHIEQGYLDVGTPPADIEAMAGEPAEIGLSRMPMARNRRLTTLP